MSQKTAKELESKYAEEDRSITQERNDFLVPQILDFVLTRKWMNLRPEYQRRQVWDRARRSLFIESLLMNLPIPPVFLFESEYNRYEVMDGQQRLSTIVDFYSNRFKLTGLQRWSELNNSTYNDLPLLIKRGLDRRRMSAVVLQNTGDAANSDGVRRTVFERLNTGGQRLNPQELRNCLYASNFSSLLVTLASNPIFTDMWEMPRYRNYINSGHASVELAANTYFKRMGDCEIVLRFFAFRNDKQIKGSVKSILDRCMDYYQTADEQKIEELRLRYQSRLKLANEMFGLDAFKINLLDKDGKVSSDGELSVPFYDGVMISLDRLFEHKTKLLRKAKTIRSTLETIAKSKRNYDVIVGRANTAEFIKRRLNLIESAFLRAL